MNIEEMGPLLVLVILFALVSTILFFLVRFWSECKRDTEYARTRVEWPTTTVKASLGDVSLKFGRVDRPPSVIGHYTYEFGGEVHTAEVYESFAGYREEREAAARELKETGKVMDLEVQYNPENLAEVSDEIVTSVPSCRWWIGGFLVFVSFLMLLILRGFYRALSG